MGRDVPSAWPPDHRHTLLAAVRSRSPDVTSLLLRGVGGGDLGGALRFPLLGKGYLLAEFLQLVVETLEGGFAHGDQASELVERREGVIQVSGAVCVR